MANGNSNGDRESRRKALEAQYAKERKAKEPTIAGSLKEGVKSALKTFGGGGMADRRRRQIREAQAAMDAEIRKQTGE